MKTLNISAIVFLLLLLMPITALWGCGSSGGSSSSADQPGDDATPEDEEENGPGSEMAHSVPEWLVGSWQVIRLRLGGADIPSQSMILTVTETGFEYHYPGCDVYGALSMDVSVPYFASNEYRLLMTSVDCVSQWDIPSFEGATDEGHVWADIGRDRFYRISDLYAQFTWIYIRQ